MNESIEPRTKNRIVLIDHHDNPPDDRVSTHLAELGYELDLRRPADGDALGELGDDLAGTVLFGGMQNVDQLEQYPFLNDEIAWVRACHERVPMLGICLGAQLIAHALGAKVTPMREQACEFGYYPVTPTAYAQSWMPQPLHVMQAHFYEFDLPHGATLLASGENCPNQAFRHGQCTYALQFHPEVTPQILRRWQDSDWAFFDADGAQSREQQDALGACHDARQHAWFVDFLTRLFGQ